MSSGDSLAEFFSSTLHLTGEFFSSLIGQGDAAQATINAVLGACLAGLTCGSIGSFITLRRMALFADMLGHAVLPGVAAGFILAGSKSTPALLLGSLAAGLLAAALTRAITSHSRIKDDASLGITLSLFYAIGIWLLSWITRASPELSSEASGLNHYLFGNPAVIHTVDLVFLASAAVVILAVLALFFKELTASIFDPSFTSSIGLPQRLFDGLLLVLLTLVIVVSLKILGVILVAALLVIPPATAYLLTDKLQRMVLLSAVLGALAGFGGVYLDFVLAIGVGPAIVCLSFLGLMAAFLGSPRHGVLGRYLLHKRLALKTLRENLLTSAWRIGEQGGELAAIPIQDLASERGETPSFTRQLARRMKGSGWGRLEQENDNLVLTESGRERARALMRGHRLWEIFLQREASLAPDHVHAGAEEIEHFLDAETLRELEDLLDNPETDPHGKLIPPKSLPGDTP